ncbi:MAG: ZIP family metal transporter [Promethearchaeota archaeon]
MNGLVLTIISTSLMSTITFSGVLTLLLKEEVLNKILLVFVGFSAGALIGGAFLHLLPEAIEALPSQIVFIPLIASFILFFVFEKLLWRHCHKAECDIHPFAYLNLIGDGVHNFIDGLVIAASFIAGIPLGIATTLAVAFHEIPQEIGDFGVIVFGGMSKRKALALNFVTALTAILGGIIGYFLSSSIQEIGILLLPFAAGGFIYIAASDLVPELHKESNPKRSWTAFAAFLGGISLMGLALLIIG